MPIKKRKNPSKEGFEKSDDFMNQIKAMVYDETKDEDYKRYKRRCYRYLVLKSLLAFILGLLTSFLLKLIVGNATF